jgi:hypothetical protein
MNRPIGKLRSAESFCEVARGLSLPPVRRSLSLPQQPSPEDPADRDKRLSLQYHSKVPTIFNSALISFPSWELA